MFQRCPRATGAVALFALFVTVARAQEVRTLDAPCFVTVAHDPVRGRSVALGQRGETVELGNLGWRLRAVPRHPDETIQVRHAEFAFDTTSGRIVMVDKIAPSYMGVRFFDGVEWTQAAPWPAPSTRTAYGLAYDDARGRLVLFGGYAPYGNPNLLGDTWLFDGSGWTSVVPANSPSPRSGVATAYDSTRSRVVLYGGGTTYPNPPLFETWEWDGVTWTQVVTAASPPSSYGAGLAFDPIRNRMVLFGGVTSPQVFGETWEYDGVNWSAQAVGGGPGPRYPARMTYDTTLGECLLAGYGCDSWSWDGTRWLAVPAAVDVLDGLGTAIATPGGDAAVVVEWGSPVPESVVFDNGWTAVPGPMPPPRIFHGTASDASFSYIYGGAAGFGTLNDLWGFDGTSWNLLSVTGPAASGGALAADTLRNELVLLRNNGLGAETWVFDGTTWQQRTPTVTPPNRSHAGMAFDPTRGVLVMFGGIGPGPIPPRDTWEWNGTTWTPILTTNSPSGGPAQLVFDTGRGEIVAALRESLHLTRELWRYDGVDWTANPLSGAPHLVGTNGLSLVGLSSGPRGPRLLLFDDKNVFDIDQDQAEVAYYGNGCGPAAPAIAANTHPAMATPDFAVEIYRAPPASPALLVGATATANINISGCTMLVASHAAVAMPTSALGTTSTQLPLPPTNAFRGVELFFQAAVLDPATPRGFALSRGLRITIGT